MWLQPSLMASILCNWTCTQTTFGFTFTISSYPWLANCYLPLSTTGIEHLWFTSLKESAWNRCKMSDLFSNNFYMFPIRILPFSNHSTIAIHKFNQERDSNLRHLARHGVEVPRLGRLSRTKINPIVHFYHIVTRSKR